MNSYKVIAGAALFASACLFAPSSAQARFLQADPLGYKDDLDLYTYAGNDPADKVDPTGLMCSGTGDKSQCTLDFYDGKKVTDQMRKDNPQIARLEANILTGYKQVQVAAAKGQNIHIPGNQKLGIKGIDISAKSLLARATMDTLDGVSANVLRTDPTSGRTYQPEIETYRTSMVSVFYKNAFGKNLWNVTQGIKHDWMHLDPKTVVWDNYPYEHQQPFDDAADSIGK